MDYVVLQAVCNLCVEKNILDNLTRTLYSGLKEDVLNVATGICHRFHNSYFCDHI